MLVETKVATKELFLYLIMLQKEYYGSIHTLHRVKCVFSYCMCSWCGATMDFSYPLHLALTPVLLKAHTHQTYILHFGVHKKNISASILNIM